MELTKLLKTLDQAVANASAARKTVEEALAAQAEASQRYQQAVTAAKTAHSQAIRIVRELEAEMRVLIDGDIGDETSARVRG